MIFYVSLPVTKNGNANYKSIENETQWFTTAKKVKLIQMLLFSHAKEWEVETV